MTASSGKRRTLSTWPALSHLAALGYSVRLNHWENEPPEPAKATLTVPICGTSTSSRGRRTHQCPLVPTLPAGTYARTLRVSNQQNAHNYLCRVLRLCGRQQ